MEINFDYFRTNEKVIESVEEVLSYDPYATFVPGNMMPSFFPGLRYVYFTALLVIKPE
jgi:hypothetical protein